MSNMTSSATIIQIPTQSNEDWQLEELDLVVRAMANPKISPAYFRLYCAMIDRWPDILTGRLIEDFSPWQLRERAGWISKESATKFINDLKSINALLEYDPGRPTKDSQGHKERIGAIRGNPDVMPYPETFLLCETDQRKKERDAQKARDAQRALILECVKCGSKNLKYDLVPICKECNFRHSPIMGVPVESLYIGESPKTDTFADDLPDFDEPVRNTEPIPPVIQLIPHCQHWQCSLGPNRTQHKLGWYYCPVHNGYIDGEGKPC